MIDEIKNDKDPMIQKAISWVLREMIRAGFNQEVDVYLHQNKNIFRLLSLNILDTFLRQEEFSYIVLD